MPRTGGGGGAAGDTGGTETGALPAQAGVRWAAPAGPPLDGAPLVGAPLVGAPLVGAPLVGLAAEPFGGPLVGNVLNSTVLARWVPAVEVANRLPSATTSSGCSMASGGSPSIWCNKVATSGIRLAPPTRKTPANRPRSEEHTSELQSRVDLVCRLLLEKKKKHNKKWAMPEKEKR